MKKEQASSPNLEMEADSSNKALLNFGRLLTLRDASASFAPYSSCSAAVVYYACAYVVFIRCNQIYGQSIAIHCLECLPARVRPFPRLRPKSCGGSLVCSCAPKEEPVLNLSPFSVTVPVAMFLPAQ